MRRQLCERRRGLCLLLAALLILCCTGCQSGTDGGSAPSGAGAASGSRESGPRTPPPGAPDPNALPLDQEAVFFWAREDGHPIRLHVMIGMMANLYDRMDNESVVINGSYVWEKGEFWLKSGDVSICFREEGDDLIFDAKASGGSGPWEELGLEDGAAFRLIKDTRIGLEEKSRNYRWTDGGSPLLGIDFSQDGCAHLTDETSSTYENTAIGLYRWEDGLVSIELSGGTLVFREEGKGLRFDPEASDSFALWGGFTLEGDVLLEEAE